jgi:hypothetical protein
VVSFSTGASNPEPRILKSKTQRSSTDAAASTAYPLAIPLALRRAGADHLPATIAFKSESLRNEPVPLFLSGTVGDWYARGNGQVGCVGCPCRGFGRVWVC